MRPCDEFLDLISASLDGELSADESALLNEHLNQCPACSALFDDLRCLREATADIEYAEAPAGFTKQVMDRIASDPTQERSSRVVAFPAKKRIDYSWKKWAVSAAVIAVVIFGAYSLPGFFSMGGSAPSSDLILARDQEKNGSIQYSAADSSAEADSADTYSGNQSEPDEDNLNVHSCSLTFSIEEKPDGLDEFPFVRDKTGTLIYTVTADYFYSVQSDFFHSTPVPTGDNVTYLICITDS